MPTVAFVARTFEDDALRSAESFGLDRQAMALISKPFTNATKEQIHQVVDECFEAVVRGVTEGAAGHAAEAQSGSADILSFTGVDALDAWDRMTEFMLQRGWSDGFPLLPATPDRVRQMVEYNGYRPDTEVTLLEPGFGRATVEKLAVNAVMAGCRPEHLPVIVAAVEALADPKTCLRNKAVSTGAAAPLILVSGPIAKRLLINSGRCCLGPASESYANSVIGRAVRLIMMNVGHAWPGSGDMDTIGSPTKYSMVLAENTAASPWAPFHVDAGYQADQSTVMVHFVYGIAELYDFENTDPENLTTMFATTACSMTQPCTGMWLLGRRADPRYGTSSAEHHTMILCPDHVDVFRRHGWGKAEIQQAMYRKARLPFRILMMNKTPDAFRASHPELAWLHDNPDVLVPVVEGPECYRIVVAGGAAGRGSFLWGSGEPVLKLVQEPARG